MLDLGDEEMVSTAFDRIIRNAKEKAPNARIDGVTVQRMARTKDALEMILGIKRDPIFGRRRCRVEPDCGKARCSEPHASAL